MKLTAELPLEDIERVQLYVNTARKSLPDIRAETGAAYILNGGIYNMSTFKPLCHLRADEVTYASDPYQYWGYLWDSADVAMGLVPDESWSNYICCVAMIRTGKPLATLYNRDMGGTRPRSAMGTKGGALCLFATSDAMTPEALQAYLMAQGWDDAVMLDGGGSTQCDFNGQTITSARRVHNLILVYLKHKEDIPMGVETYSLAKDGDTYLSRNFRVREFRCRDGSDAILISDELVTLLQAIRDHFGCPVTINSAYRTKTHNAAVGGASKSQHLLGTAADIVVPNTTPLLAAQYAEHLLGDRGGIGVYNSFIHVDVRAACSRWDSRSGKEVAVSGWPGYEEEPDAPSDWARESWEKAVALGVFDGTDPRGPLTREQAAVVLDRLGLLERG